MTETATESVETPSVPENPFIAAGRTQYDLLAGQVSTIAEKVQSANNVLALVQDVRDNSDDEKIAAFREYREKVLSSLADAEAGIDEYIRKAGLVNVEPVDVEALTKTHAELLTAARNILKAVVGVTKDEDAVKDWPALKGIPGSRSSGDGRGAGVPKPRIQKIVITHKGETTEVFDAVTKDGVTTNIVSLTVLGTFLNGMLKKANVDDRVDSGNLRDAVFEAAGTSDLRELNGKPFSFSYTVGPVTLENVEITPKVAS